jgi:IMP dehydrogenase/GMP reductase
MRVRLVHRIAFILVATFMIGLCFVEADAQQQRRRRRTSRRVTNPVVSNTPTTQPNTTTTNTNTTTADPRIISTADDPANSQSGDQTRRTRRTRAATDDPDSMRRTVDKLSTEVTRLTDKIGQMEQQQRTLVDLERLSRAEQRAENFRKQLLDVSTKQADLEARRDQIDSDLRPENIERVASANGSTRPEDVRAERRRQLENERARVQAQLDLMAQSRARLEAAVASADAEVDALRTRLDAPPATGAPTLNTNVETGATPTPQPTTPAPGPSTNTDSGSYGTPR